MLRLVPVFMCARVRVFFVCLFVCFVCVGGNPLSKKTPQILLNYTGFFYYTLESPGEL